MFENTKAFSGFSVDDLAIARKFYGETLGIEVEDKTAQERHGPSARTRGPAGVASRVRGAELRGSGGSRGGIAGRCSFCSGNAGGADARRHARSHPCGVRARRPVRPGWRPSRAVCLGRAKGARAHAPRWGRGAAVAAAMGIPLELPAEAWAHRIAINAPARIASSRVSGWRFDPMPAGTPSIRTTYAPPSVSPAVLARSIAASIRVVASPSGQRTLLASIADRCGFSSPDATMTPIRVTYESVSMPSTARNCAQIEPSATRPRHPSV